MGVAAKSNAAQSAVNGWIRRLFTFASSSAPLR
jgi:hypothetical protein